MGKDNILVGKTIKPFYMLDFGALRLAIELTRAIGGLVILPNLPWHKCTKCHQQMTVNKVTEYELTV